MIVGLTTSYGSLGKPINSQAARAVGYVARKGKKGRRKKKSKMACSDSEMRLTIKRLGIVLDSPFCRFCYEVGVLVKQRKRIHFSVRPPLEGLAPVPRQYQLGVLVDDEEALFTDWVQTLGFVCEDASGDVEFIRRRYERLLQCVWNFPVKAFMAREGRLKRKKVECGMRIFRIGENPVDCTRKST